MAAAIERYLKDFGQSDPFVLAPAVDADDTPSLGLIETVEETITPAMPAIDIEAECAAAYDRGQKEAADTLALAHATELEAERARQLEELNELRTRFEQDFSTTLAARFDQLAGDLIETVGDHVARIIAPALEQALTDRMVAELSGAISATLTDREGTRIAVSGSPSMHESIAEALGDRAEQLDFTPSEAFDLTVRIDETVLATRLSEWAVSLREVLS